MWKPVYLFACFAVTLGCGTLYAYSAYAPQLSERLQLSASTISTIGMLGNFSMSFSGPFAGLVVDNHGFLLPVVTSILCTFAGYAIVLTAYERAISSVPLLCLALFLVGVGSTCAFSAAVKCAALNFPTFRGTATAVTMSGYGLSAFLMSVVAQIFSGSGSGTGAGIGGAVRILSVLVVLPALLMAVFGPIVVRGQHKTVSAAPAGGSAQEIALDPMGSDLLVERISERQRAERELYGLQLLRTPAFWVYFLILGLLAGMGQAYIYTCGYMVKSLFATQASNIDGTVSSPDPEVVAPLQAHQVAIISVANCAGRLLSGTFSDTVKNQLRLPRVAALSLALCLCLAAMIAAQRVKTFAYMFVPSTLVGLFYGAVFGAFPGIISDSFGVRRLSSNWGVVALAPIPFSTFLAIRIGKMYDAGDAGGAYILHIVLAVLAFGLLALALRMHS